MPRVLSLDEMLRDSVDSGDLIVIYDGSAAQDEPLHKIKARELSNALQSFVDSGDTLHSVTNNGNTTSNSITVGGMTVTGDLQVDGTTTTINSTEMTVNDKNIVLADGAANAAAANGGGITIDGANATIQYSSDSDVWAFNKNVKAPNLLSDLSGQTTDNLSEGSTNLYYTNSRWDSDWDSAVASKLSAKLIIYDSANVALKTVYGSPTGYDA
tara:strand:- start:1998 stop:2636 length:639 start_codon:yes stop_codon:yes gene_type:complete